MAESRLGQASRRERARRMRAAGRSVRGIAQTLGCSPYTVYSLLRVNGVTGAACDAVHPWRKEARCERGAGHGGYHTWSAPKDCPHERTTIRGGLICCVHCGRVAAEKGGKP